MTSTGRALSLDEDSMTVTGTIGDVDDQDKIVINVGGIRHETLTSTLLAKSHTRLGYLARKHRRGVSDEYFFDRHPGVFSTVMDFYRTGELHVPLNVCGAVVKRELDWWQVDDSLIEPCCWIKYSKYIDTQKTLADFNDNERQEVEEFEALKSKTGWRLTQANIWMILDYPGSSRLALAYAVTSFLFIVASISGFCIETLPELIHVTNVTRQCGPDSPVETIELPMPHQFLKILDYVCTAFFSVELIVRIAFSPNKRQFFTSIMNIIDILALLPLYVQNFLELTDGYTCLGTNRVFVETIFILRIIRIFRIFHILKHYKALKILLHAIKASMQELLMLAIFLFIGMLIFSTMIFYAEGPNPFIILDGSEKVKFNTIPIGFWWSIITMTTVGYGDVFPDTALGCAIGMLCAVSGVLLVALTIPVISNNFALFYLHARTRDSIANTSSNNDIVMTVDQNGSRLSKQSSNVTIERVGRTNFTNDKRHWDIRATLPVIESNSTLAEDAAGGGDVVTHRPAPDDVDSLATIPMIDDSKSASRASRDVTQENNVNPSAHNAHV